MKRIAAMLLLLPFLLTACGGGGTSPEDQVTEVADQINNAETPEEIRQVCEEKLTPAFIDEVYGGSIRKCEKKPVNDEEEAGNPGKTEVESVEVDASKASATMKTVGGDIAGAGGTWTFAESDGDWRLDRIEDDFLRDSLATSIQVVDEGAMNYEPMRGCMATQVGNLKSATLRSMMFETMRGEKKKALKSVLSIAKSCPDQMAGYVADELATRVIVEQGASPARVKCARRNLVPLLKLTGLAEMAMSSSIGGGDDGITGAALAGLITGAVKGCPA